MPLVLKAISFQSASMGEEAERAFDEQGGTFGRSKSCDWVLPDPERYISGKHGEVFFQNGRYHLTDTSTNGLMLEGQAMPIGKGNSVPLNHGDVLLLGEYRLQVILEEESDNLPDPRAPETAIREPLEAGTSGSLDPLDFLSSEPSPSTQEPSAGSESQADHSSIANDHFQVPGVGSRDLVPPVESPPLDQASSVAAESPQIISEPPLQEGDGLIGEDWNVTDLDPKPVESGHGDGEPLPSYSIGSQPETAASSEAVSRTIEEPETAPLEASEPQPKRERDPLSNECSQTSSPPFTDAVPRQRAEQDAKQSSSGGIEAVSESILYQAFLQGLGVNDGSDVDCSVETMRSYGELLRLMIASLMELLSARTEFKNEFRLSRTVLKPQENNPLKFSPNVNEALRIFLNPGSSGYLGLDDSVRDSLVDMKCHQIALVAGLQAVFQEFSSLMSPERYIVASDAGVKALLQSITQKSRNWEQFCAYCDRLERESPNGVSGHFSDVFADAYEERIIMLNTNERRPD